MKLKSLNHKDYKSGSMKHSLSKIYFLFVYIVSSCTGELREHDRRIATKHRPVNTGEARGGVRILNIEENGGEQGGGG